MGLKDQLEAAGYDTSTLNEADMVQKLDQAGYDTSSLGATAPSQPQDTQEQVLSLPGNATQPLIALEKGARVAADKIGEFVASNLAEGPMKLHPKMAAAIGTAFQMIPDTIEAFGPGAEAAKGATAAKDAVMASKTVQALKGTGTAEVARLTEKAAEMPLMQTAKAGMAQDVLKASKTGIQSTEAKLGLKNPELGQAFQKLVSNKGDLSNFAQKMSDMADKGPEYLSKVTDSQTLHNIKKTLQEGLKSGGESLNDLSRVQLSKAKKVFSEALEMQHPDLKEALGKYRDIQAVVDNLPARFKQEKQMLNLALTKARNLAKSQQGIRTAAGRVMRGAEYAAGGTAIYKLVKGQ